ncbi:MAG: hypothetical protein ACOCZ9_01980 [Spirochaetota bacterium]
MKDRTDWVAIGGLSLLAALIFQTGALFLLFPAPLQFLRGKTDSRHFTIGCLVSAFFVAVIVGFRVLGAPDDLTGVALLDGLVPLGLIIAIWVLNEVRLPTGGRTAVLGLAGGLVGLMAIPSIVMLVESEVFRGQIASQIAAAEQAVADVSDGAGIVGMFGAEDMDDLVSAIWVRTFAGGFTVTLGVNYILGSRLAGATDDRALERYRTPDWVPFALLFGLAGVVLEASFGLSAAGIVGWNVLVFSAAVFGAQGLGLLQFVVGANGTRPGRRALVPLALLVLLFLPVTGGLVLLGLPAAGIGEHWIKRRDRGMKAE